MAIPDPIPTERIARAFHEAYETLAPAHDYKTRGASAKPWAEVPEQNKRFMIEVFQSLINTDVIVPGVLNEV